MNNNRSYILLIVIVALATTTTTFVNAKTRWVIFAQLSVAITFLKAVATIKFATISNIAEVKELAASN